MVVPSGVDGNYQWQVHVNSQGDVFEGINWTNNVTSSSATTTLMDPTLTVGGPAVTNFFTAAGQSDVFALTSTGGSNFVLTAQGSTAGSALVLYVGDGYVPSPSAFDQESSQFNSPLASVTVPGLLNHTYYVVVYARSLDAPAVGFTLSATSLSFALNSVSPSSIANSGPVTLQILGELLAANDNFTLVGPGGTFAGSAAQSPDSTVAYATFNLNSAAVGVYSLSVTQPGGASLTLANAVSVTSSASVATAASFIVQLQTPPAYRSDRPIDGTIVYRNAGEVDMPAPILILSSGGIAGLALQGNTNFIPNDLLLIGVSFRGRQALWRRARVGASHLPRRPRVRQQFISRSIIRRPPRQI